MSLSSYKGVAQFKKSVKMGHPSGQLLMSLQNSSENALEQRRSPTSQWFSRYFNFLQKKGVAGIASKHLIDT